MGKVLKADASVADAFAEIDLGSQPEIWVTERVFFADSALTFWTGATTELLSIWDPPHTTDAGGIWADTAWNTDDGIVGGTPTGGTWHTIERHLKFSATQIGELYVDGAHIGSDSSSFGPSDARYVDVGLRGFGSYDPASLAYFDDIKIGTTRHASDLFSDDFESGNLSAWTSTSGDVSVIDDPTGFTSQRVGVAFGDGPLEPNPTWTWLDGSDFPDQFVSGYDTKSGRQTLISQTDTGTATVYVNDHELGLFDDRNLSSPYQGKLSGRQILLQLWNPVTEEWESQFRGWIKNYHYDIDGSAVRNPWDAPEDRQPINASIQIECVDIFDKLGGFGLTPGLAGVRPPAGAEDGVYYAEGHVDDRQIEILTDVGIPVEMYGSPDLASGNVNVIAVKYDPDESALVGLRDAADAEFPFIANIYVDRFGRYQFRGRYGRFDPDDVAAEPGSDWDFTRWAVGDGAAIAADPTRAQMRVLGFDRDVDNIINVAIAYPQGLAAADMPNQVFASIASINAYFQHAAPPMSDLLTANDGLTSGSANAKQECFRFAKLLVKNQAFPRESITALQVKAIDPSDARAEATWAVLTRSDISHIINVAVGYPGGTGFAGSSPEDDYYIEGRSLTVRPLNPTHDYVELDLEVSPAVWSMDTHGVFPPFSGVIPLMADFDIRAQATAGDFSFTDRSIAGPSGPITAWDLDYGDGTSHDTGPGPWAHTYAANGTYEVTLTVTGTGGDGTDDEVKPLKVAGV